MSTKQRIAKLRAEIVEIQSVCKHAFILEKQPRLKESLQPGVFILDYETHAITLICTKCDIKKETTVAKICPHCLSAMPPRQDPYKIDYGDFAATARYTEKYYGKEVVESIMLGYYVPIVSRCPKCSFANVHIAERMPLK